MIRNLLAISLTLTLGLSVTAAPTDQVAVLRSPAGVDVVTEAACVPLRISTGETVAEMHAYAYTLDTSDPDRPITFLWNGGPGASAALLHTGFAGPLVATVDDDGDALLQRNPLSLIDQTDLVYVDPIGTGLSRVAEGIDAKRLWAVVPDAMAAAKFVVTYMSDRNLTGRPVVLAGESYGAIRVAYMLEPLRQWGVDVRGVLLISPALESGLLSPRSDHDRKDRRADNLPTLAAIAQHQGHIFTNDLRSFIEGAVGFAQNEYREALEHIGVLGEAQLDEIRAHRDTFTDGLETHDLTRYGQYDARERTVAGGLAGVTIENIKSSLALLLRERFEIDTQGEYAILNMRANATWRGPGDTNRHFSRTGISAPARIAADALAQPDRPLRVFVAGGWYDLVTPFASARRLHAEGAFGGANVTVRDYPAGHVIYADPDAHGALVRDLRAWYARIGSAVASPERAHRDVPVP